MNSTPLRGYFVSSRNIMYTNLVIGLSNKFDPTTIPDNLYVEKSIINLPDSNLLIITVVTGTTGTLLDYLYGRDI